MATKQKNNLGVILENKRLKEHKVDMGRQRELKVKKKKELKTQKIIYKRIVIGKTGFGTSYFITALEIQLHCGDY